MRTPSLIKGFTIKNLKIQRLTYAVLAGLIIAGSAGCSVIKFPGVYKVRVAQGNIIDPKAVKKVKLGMTKRQVRFVLGSPLIIDTFNPDRWDYFYQRSRGGKILVERELTLHFAEDKLQTMEGNMVPKDEDPAKNSQDTPPPAEQDVSKDAA